MKSKGSFGDQLEAFFEGKGFYIVLFLCAAVIGVSAWVLIGTSVEDRTGNMSAEGVVVTPGEIQTSVSTPAPTPTAPETAAPAVTPQATAETGTAVWNEDEPAADIFVWPVNGEMITPYAVDRLIYDQTMADWRAHSGIDIAVNIGTQVMAVSSGEVVNLMYDDMYGTTVIIAHADGVESIYANLAAQPTVNVGDTVEVGDVIGAVGDTAICESAIAPHLHFAMTRDGDSVDPAEYLP